jgi:NADPH2 dehydrogenase
LSVSVVFQVTEAVHAKKSFIYCQLWALGRAADASQLAEENLVDAYSAPSPILISTSENPYPPRELTVSEIQEYVQLYATAASNAIEAGFDGVELHGANGYIIDQFLQDVSNKRKDEYGGSVENRARFAWEVVDAVVQSIGAGKTALRISPWSRFAGLFSNFVASISFHIFFRSDMRMQDPIPTFSHLVTIILEAHPGLAYIHVVEPRVSGASDYTGFISHDESNGFIRDIVQEKGKGTKVISTGGYTRESGIAAADAKGDLIGYARSFLANVSVTVVVSAAC